jgi:hypothetical protein
MPYLVCNLLNDTICQLIVRTSDLFIVFQCSRFCMAASLVTSFSNSEHIGGGVMDFNFCLTDFCRAAELTTFFAVSNRLSTYSI